VCQVPLSVHGRDQWQRWSWLPGCRDQGGRGLGSRALIIRLIIQTIRRDPTGSDQIDDPSNVSRPDRSGADQIDAEHQATDLAVGGSNPSRRTPSAQVNGLGWSHAGRLRSEAAFAALAGANPIPESSGQVTRHRLNRSGDRQLNRALHTVVVARLRDDPATRAYAARRTSEGKSTREIRRCLKRAVARQLFKLLERYDRPPVELIKVA